MKPIAILRRAMILAGAIAPLACTWVSLTSEGQDVRILRASEVTECQKVGKATTKTSDRVIIFARTDRKVREELESLARNEAADLGGDAIVPIGTAADGRQSFDVYRCGIP